MKSAIMKYAKLFRAIWFMGEVDRSWLAVQFATHYATCRKSVVLYALKRLELIFRMPFTSFDGDIELLALHENYKKLNKRHWLSFLLPEEFHRNPLQIISDDFSCAEDDSQRARKMSQADISMGTPLNEHSTVSDYVRFIVEYDTMCLKTDRLRVTSRLGSTPP